MRFGTAIFAISCFLVPVFGQLETVYEWRHIDYLWPSEEARERAVRTGTYNISDPIPTDVDVSQDGRVFVSLVGSKAPARLGVVTNHMGPSGPLLQPYPSWDWTDKDSCDSIITPWRIEIDDCNRLWVIDSAQTGEGKPRNCHPKLLAFNLWSNTLITRIDIPEDIATNEKNLTLFTNIRVETHGQYCEDVTVYMADSFGRGLVIWDGNQLFRLENPSFDPRPEASNFTTGNDFERMSIGILGMDISPRIFPNEPQYLYYRPLSSFGLFAARTDQLKNSANDQKIEIAGTNDGLRSQSCGHAFSTTGTLFLGGTKELSLVCWNRYRPFNQENIVTVARDNERLQYASGIKVIPVNVFGEEEVWLITDRLLRHDAGKDWNPKEINYRILKSPVKRLIAGTNCEMPFEVRYQLATTQNQWFQ